MDEMHDVADFFTGWDWNGDGQSDWGIALHAKVNEQGFGIIVFDAGQNGPVYDAARLILQRDGASASDGQVILVWDK